MTEERAGGSGFARIHAYGRSRSRGHGRQKEMIVISPKVVDSPPIPGNPGVRCVSIYYLVTAPNYLLTHVLTHVLVGPHGTYLQLFRPRLTCLLTRVPGCCIVLLAKFAAGCSVSSIASSSWLLGPLSSVSPDLHTPNSGGPTHQPREGCMPRGQVKCVLHEDTEPAKWRVACAEVCNTVQNFNRRHARARKPPCLSGS